MHFLIHKGCDITLAWIPEHMDIGLNEIADALAREQRVEKNLGNENPTSRFSPKDQ